MPIYSHFLTNILGWRVYIGFGVCQNLLDEDLAQARLAEGVVLEVEAIEAVKRVLVRMHVQSVHIQVIPVHSHKPEPSALMKLLYYLC